MIGSLSIGSPQRLKRKRENIVTWNGVIIFNQLAVDTSRFRSIFIEVFWNAPPPANSSFAIQEGIFGLNLLAAIPAQQYMYFFIGEGGIINQISGSYFAAPIVPSSLTINLNPGTGGVANGYVDGFY